MKSMMMFNVDDKVDSKLKGMESDILSENLRQIAGKPTYKIDAKPLGDFKEFFGIWSKSDLEDFKTKTCKSRRIVPEDWK